MLTPYSTDAIRDRITLIYRGYDLELTRAPSGWLVGCTREARTFPFFQEVIFLLAMKTARLSKQKSE